MRTRSLAIFALGYCAASGSSAVPIGPSARSTNAVVHRAPFMSMPPLQFADACGQLL